ARRRQIPRHRLRHRRPRRPGPHRRRQARRQAVHAQGARRRGRRGAQPRAAVRRGLFRLLPRRDEGGGALAEAQGAGRRAGHYYGRHRPAFGGRLRARHRPQGRPARHGARAGAAAGRRRAPGLPVQQRHPQQRGRAAERGV
ncbi:MAG: Organic hydroperoxide resistance protein, partial [uncultured Sphingomonadaceae bacterium]